MAQEHDSQGIHHIVSQAQLVRTFVALVVLMALTILAARAPYDIPGFAWMKPLWPVTNTIAIGIAVWKASLVISIFMGVKFSSKLIRVFAIGGFVWLMLLFGSFADYWTRNWESVKGWEDVPETSMPRPGTSTKAPARTTEPVESQSSH